MQGILRKPTDDKRIAQPKKVSFDVEARVEPTVPKEINKGTISSQSNFNTT